MKIISLFYSFCVTSLIVSNTTPHTIPHKNLEEWKKLEHIITESINKCSNRLTWNIIRGENTDPNLTIFSIDEYCQKPYKKILKIVRRNIKRNTENSYNSGDQNV